MAFSNESREQSPLNTFLFDIKGVPVNPYKNNSYFPEKNKISVKSDGQNVISSIGKHIMNMI